VREFITAGDMQEKVPAHSPIPQLLINALNGAADPYKLGVVSGEQLAQYIWAETRGLGISPRHGKLPGGYFDRGEFLFRAGMSNIVRPPVNDTNSSAAGGVFACKFESGVRSLESRYSTHLVFRNQSLGKVSTWWVNDRGKRVFYSELAPGEEYSQQTYISHPWVIIDDKGRCLELVLPSSDTRTIDIK
jgi:hypothetical protein